MLHYHPHGLDDGVDIRGDSLALGSTLSGEFAGWRMDAPVPWAFLLPHTVAPLPEALTTAPTPLILSLQILEATGEMMTAQVWEGICV